MRDFELFLFSKDPSFIRRAVAAGVSGIVVDWETADKPRRQAGYDTEINIHTVQDLERVREATPAPVLCRVNNTPDRLRADVEAALDRGADEILLPMVRSVEEVERAFDHARGRGGIGILIETLEAVAAAADLSRLPLARSCSGLRVTGQCRRSRPTANGSSSRPTERVDANSGSSALTAPRVASSSPVGCRSPTSPRTRASRPTASGWCSPPTAAASTTSAAEAGAVSAWLSLKVATPWIFVATLAAIASAVLIGYVLENRADPKGSVGMTTEVAAITVTLLGGMVAKVVFSTVAPVGFPWSRVVRRSRRIFSASALVVTLSGSASRCAL